ARAPPGAHVEGRVARHRGERGPRALTPVPEVVGHGLVVELHDLGVADQLEPDADRQPRGRDRVAGEAVGVAGIGTRAGRGAAAGPRAPAREGAGGRPRGPGAAMGWGTSAPPPPPTVSGGPVT